MYLITANLRIIFEKQKIIATFVEILYVNKNKIMRHLLIILFILLTLSPSHAQTTPYSAMPPKHEVRAVWLTTIGGIDWPHSYAQGTRSIEKQQNELRRILDQLQQTGINTVLLQTRIRGTVIYPSSYEPWDGCLSGKPGTSPGYDALQFAIDECHQRGMELHAWIVTMPVGKWDALGCRQLRKKMPHNLIKIKGDGYLNPESQQTADYLASLCAEVTRQYDIDGIHLDYIRYPEDLPKLKSLDRQHGRSNITRIVSAISRRVKSLKPWVKMSCSPIGKYDDTARYWSHGWNANTTVCQDAVAWLRDGLMDELFPMMYFRDNNFFPFALDWKEQSHGRIIVPGLGIYFMSPSDTPLAILLRDKNSYCRYPSLVPPMTWASRRKPDMPSQLSLSSIANGVSLLSWSHTEKDTTMMMFNIYASKKYPVDTDDARNLIAIRRQGRQLFVPNDGCTHYAVTATDRYGNESKPLQEDAPYDYAETQCSNTRLLNCDGKKVEVPEASRLADTEFLLVESLQGVAITTLPYNPTAKTANISRIKDGMYQLRSLNRKGKSHRLGMFIIKR